MNQRWSSFMASWVVTRPRCLVIYIYIYILMALIIQDLPSNMHMICCWFGSHEDVIKWKHFLHYRPFVRGIHRSPVNSPHKGQWRGGLTFSLICTWRNDWVNNRDAGDLRRYRAHYDVTIMLTCYMKNKVSDWHWPYTMRTTPHTIYARHNTFFGFGVWQW